MASIRKRGDRWRVEVCSRGQRASNTFSTKKQAQLWANEKELEFEGYAGLNVIQGKTVAEAYDRYAREVSVNKKGARWEMIRLESLSRYPFAKRAIADIRAGDIAAWRDFRLTEGVKSATVRRELQLISSVLSVARREWHWIKDSPMKDVVRPKNSRPRDRRISKDEIERLLQVLGWQEGEPIVSKKHLVASYMLLALESAMRLGEMCNMGMNEIDVEKRCVTLLDTKNSDIRKVPLSQRAISILKNIVTATNTVSSNGASSIFHKAVRVAEIKDLKFHDTRHEAITRLAKKLDILDLARMVGHRDPRSLMIYYNATPLEIASQLD